MNEDEIIKNLNDLLEHNYLEDVGYLREENDYVVYNNAIQGLLDLYKQEKEKNKELEEKLKMSIAMLTKGTYPETEKGANDFDNYFISKDKIRAKIKELTNNVAPNIEERDAQIYACDILEELLEE